MKALDFRDALVSALPVDLYGGPAIEKRCTMLGAESVAVFSPCERYRYSLSRTWAAGPHAVWCMLNPSTADERENDPTITRVETFTRGLLRPDGKRYGGWTVVNLYAWRSTDPMALRGREDPVGPLNDEAIAWAFQNADIVICAWGVYGSVRGPKVVAAAKAMKVPLYAMAFTAGRIPRHPLYLSGKTRPERWQ